MDCPEPPASTTEFATPGVFVSWNCAGVGTPATVAFTVYLPAVVLAVNCGAVTTPFESVVKFPPAANIPPGPEDGTVNVTVRFLTGFPDASRTRTLKFVAKGVLT